MMKINQVMASLILLGVCATTVSQYYLKIYPLTSDACYTLKLGAVLDLKVYAYKDEKTLATINKIWWRFDKFKLEKIGASTNSIQLKAIKEGRCTLSIIADVEYHNLQKDLTIIIEK